VPRIELKRASEGDFECIEHLMQFYVYDLSEWLALELRADGRYPVQASARYLSQPATRSHLIYVNDELAGFVSTDAQTHHAEASHNLAYLFVARRFRRQGIGRRVVTALLRDLPGGWQIFHITQNLAAAAFWKRVVPQLCGGEFSVHLEVIDHYECTLYLFNHEAVATCAFPTPV